MKLVVALIFATVLVVFGAQNTQSVTFHFIVFDVGPAPVVFAVFVAALVGVVIGWLVSVPGRLHGLRTRQDLEREVAAAHERTAAAVAEMEETEERGRPPSQGSDQRDVRNLLDG